MAFQEKVKQHEWWLIPLVSIILSASVSFTISMYIAQNNQKFSERAALEEVSRDIEKLHEQTSDFKNSINSALNAGVSFDKNSYYKANIEPKLRSLRDKSLGIQAHKVIKKAINRILDLDYSTPQSIELAEKILAESIKLFQDELDL